MNETNLRRQWSQVLNSIFVVRNVTIEPTDRYESAGPRSARATDSDRIMVPFGYRKVVKKEGGKRVKQLEPVPEKQTAIKRMRRLHREGKSLRAISQDMKKRGHNLSHEGVKRVLERKP